MHLQLWELKFVVVSGKRSQVVDPNFGDISAKWKINEIMCRRFDKKKTLWIINELMTMISQNRYYQVKWINFVNLVILLINATKF